MKTQTLLTLVVLLMGLSMKTKGNYSHSYKGVCEIDKQNSIQSFVVVLSWDDC